MPAWKILLICLLACACLALALSTVLVTISHEGTQRWLWMAGLLAATGGTTTLFVLFMRHASGAMDAKPRRGNL